MTLGWSSAAWVCMMYACICGCRRCIATKWRLLLYIHVLSYVMCWRSCCLFLLIRFVVHIGVFFFLTHGPYEPLRSVTTLLHSSLSTVSRTTSGNGRPHQSMKSSTHLLGILPLCRSPSTMPSMIVFVSLLTGIRHIWPNNCSYCSIFHQICFHDWHLFVHCWNLQTLKLTCHRYAVLHSKLWWKSYIG